MAPPTRSAEEVALDALWDRRVAKRRKWDRVYQRLNAALFATLLITMLVYFAGLWDLVDELILR